MAWEHLGLWWCGGNWKCGSSFCWFWMEVSDGKKTNALFEIEHSLSEYLVCVSLQEKPSSNKAHRNLTASFISIYLSILIRPDQQRDTWFWKLQSCSLLHVTYYSVQGHYTKEYGPKKFFCWVVVAFKCTPITSHATFNRDVSNSRPASQIRPAFSFYLMCESMQEIMFFIIKTVLS